MDKLSSLVTYNNLTVDANKTLNEDMGSNSNQNGSTYASSAGEFCGPQFKSFEQSYKIIHGYASLAVSLVGTNANILNLIVLSQQEMINPTNAIITALALADLLTMMEYILYAVYLILPGSKSSYAWASFVLIHSNFSQV